MNNIIQVATEQEAEEYITDNNLDISNRNIFMTSYGCIIKLN